MTHNSTNKSRSASQQREKQTGSPNTTTTTTTANASNCNFILKSLYNLDHLALLNSTIHGITGANELTSNPGVNRPNSSQMELPTEKKPSVKSHTNSIVRASRNLPVKKVSLVKAIEPTRLLSNTVELSGLVDTISNESSTAFDPHKLSHKSFESSFTQPRYSFVYACPDMWPWVLVVYFAFGMGSGLECWRIICKLNFKLLGITRD